MSRGGLERESLINNMKIMAELLHTRNYPNLELKTHIFENETHASCYPVSLTRALKVLYNE